MSFCIRNPSDLRCRGGLLLGLILCIMVRGDKGVNAKYESAHRGLFSILKATLQEVKQLPVNWVSTYQWEESEQ
ncbi:hypothetical protein D3C76_1610380 [compost metagenome]